MGDNVSKRININRIIRLGDRKLTVLEYLRDTEYSPVLIKIMAEQNCSAIEALKYAKEHNISLG